MTLPQERTPEWEEMNTRVLDTASDFVLSTGGALPGEVAILFHDQPTGETFIARNRRVQGNSIVGGNRTRILGIVPQGMQPGKLAENLIDDGLPVLCDTPTLATLQSGLPLTPQGRDVFTFSAPGRGLTVTRINIQPIH